MTLHRFHSTYGTLRPQGWRVHYTCSGGDIIWPRGVFSSLVYYAAARRKGATSIAFVRPSVTYIANNSRTQRPSVPKFGRKVPHLRCDSHTSFKVKRSKVRVRGGRGHNVSAAEPGGHTACLLLFYENHTKVHEIPSNKILIAVFTIIIIIIILNPREKLLLFLSWSSLSNRYCFCYCCCYKKVKKFEDMFSRSHTMHERESVRQA